MNSKLDRMLRLIDWLDKVRWKRERNTISGLLEIDTFKKLPADQKILVHWLCYITDRMRPFEEVWQKGGQIFSEVVEKYASEEISNQEQLVKKILNSCDGFLTPPKNGIIYLFQSKVKKNNEDFIKFGIRFQNDLYSIARTLTILLDYEKSLIAYLNSKIDFWDRGEDKLGKIAYVLHLLTYMDVKDKFGDFEGDKATKFLEDVAQHKKLFEFDFTDGYNKWNKSRRFNSKRLWAALRDYVKPGSPLKQYFFESSLENKRYLQDPEELFNLEFPGDVWNNRFFLKVPWAIFKSEKHNVKEIKGSSSFRMRRLFESLSKQERNEHYPEQFDVSFDFSPRMCEQNLEDFCLFRKVAAQRVCWKSQFPETSDDLLKDKFCPVTLISCEYFFKCEPTDCPVANYSDMDLCEGCNLKV